MRNKRKRTKGMHEKVILGHRDGSAHLKEAVPKPGFQHPPHPDPQGKRRLSSSLHPLILNRHQGMHLLPPPDEYM